LLFLHFSNLSKIKPSPVAGQAHATTPLENSLLKRSANAGHKRTVLKPTDFALNYKGCTEKYCQNKRKDDAMTQIMTPSTMTDGQIDKAVEVISSKLRKELRAHQSELQSDPVQLVLGQDDLGDALYDVFRTRVEAISQTSVEEVDYDDPQWKTIDKSRYAFVGNVTAAHYPETETGKKLVRFRELEFNHDPTDDEVLTKAAKLNCRQTSRAEVETYIRKRYTPEQLAKNPRIGLIGSAVKRRGLLSRAYVDGFGAGVGLSWPWTDGHWDRRCRFVAACK